MVLRSSWLDKVLAVTTGEIDAARLLFSLLCRILASSVSRTICRKAL